MIGRCPNLGLVGNRKHVFSVATHRHRCYVREQPERIGSEHQATLCLTVAYHRCPRLGGKTASEWPAIANQALPGSGATLSQIKSEGARSTGREPGSRPDLLYTGLRPELGREKEKSRRSWSMTEFTVMGLGLAILLAFSFIGYAVFYRLKVGPGMAAPSLVAEAGAVATATITPTSEPTVVAPTLSPTALAAILVPESPSPTPEPLLPTATAASRPAADSPPTRLVIPKIVVDIPVLPVGVKTVVERGGSRVLWADVPNAGGFHQTSAYPGQAGNIVINGHRDIQGSVFRNLDKVEIGDEIRLYVNEAVYEYYVTETLVVPETFASLEQRLDNLRLIGTMPEERLTLITCTPVGLATHRLLVIAKPPDQIAPQMPEAGQSIQP
jgi:LPXTG-site transpeptidase (sortase) family protein